MKIIRKVILLIISAIIVVLLIKAFSKSAPVDEVEVRNVENEEDQTKDENKKEIILEEPIVEEVTEPEKEHEEEQSVMSASDISQLEAFTVIDTSAISPDMIQELFYAGELTEDIMLRIQGNSYTENDNITLDELKYVRVLHVGFDGETHIGELIVNEVIADDIISIMKILYENEYPIEKIVLIDQYDADDNLSMEDNNSSAFNYRTIAGTTRLSKHSLGMAVDINPKFNPYIRKDADGNQIVEPANGVEFTERTENFPYKIDSDDLCYKTFVSHGFTWGGDWNSVKDYQHFEKSLDNVSSFE